MGLLEIEQKKGKPDYIDGRLTVFAIVDIDPSEFASSNHPILSMVHNSLLVAQGNYKDQSSLKDFLQSELGESLEEGLEAFLEKFDGLESALDPQKLKEKMKSLDDLKDFIPTPAKIVPFHSEEEIIKQEGDVFYVGKFKNMANANLSINSFPILYQARYREQEIDMIRSEIDQLISQVETSEVPNEHYTSSGVDIESNIVKDYIPNLLYSRRDKDTFKRDSQKLKDFLRGYKFPDDINKMITLIKEPEKLSPLHYKLLELYAKKISEVSKENFAEVDRVGKEIALTEEEMSKE